MDILRYEPFFDKILFSHCGELYLTDEDVRPSKKVKLVTNKTHPFNGLSAPTRIQIQFTNRCNLNCKHCYVSSGKTLPNELSSEDIFKTLEQAVELGVLQIDWSGGEPFSRKGFMDVVEITRRYGFEQKLLTNGVAIGLGLSDLKQLWKCFFEIQISVDNIGDGFNTFVGKKRWSDVNRSISLLLGCMPKGRNLSLTTTLDRSNITFLSDIYEYMSDKDVSWKIGRQVHNGRSTATETECDQLLFSSWEQLQQLRKKPSKARILHLFDKTEDLDSIWPTEWQTEPGARWFVYVKASGDAYPFPYFDGVQAFWGGNVKQAGLAEIWRSEAFNRYRSVTRAKTKCCKCALICQMWSRSFSYFKRMDLLENPIEHPNCPLTQ